MRIMVIGGGGYVGHQLVPSLLLQGHFVVVYDTFWFGNFFSPHERLMLVSGDVRQIANIRNIDIVIHLACLSNDPSSEIDKELTKSINYDAFEPVVQLAKDAGVRRFIYASSSSVYGISEAEHVTEDHPCKPITLYNTYKAMCEEVLLKHASPEFCCTVLRPSTLCGYSPRMRLDLALNILTNLAVSTGLITVHGGQQMRPNLHIIDMVWAYIRVLNAPVEKIAGQVFNVGAGNVSIMDLALLVQKLVPSQIEVAGSVDPRSYRVNSDKILKVLGFRPGFELEDAVIDMIWHFQAGDIPNSLADDRYYNVRQMRKIFPRLYEHAPPLKVDPTKGHLSEADVVHR